MKCPCVSEQVKSGIIRADTKPSLYKSAICWFIRASSWASRHHVLTPEGGLSHLEAGGTDNTDNWEMTEIKSLGTRYWKHRVVWTIIGFFILSLEPNNAMLQISYLYKCTYIQFMFSIKTLITSWTLKCEKSNSSSNFYFIIILLNVTIFYVTWRQSRNLHFTFCIYFHIHTMMYEI